MDTWSQSNNRIPPDRWPPFDHRSELPADRDRREDTRGSGRGTDPGGGSSLATSIPGRRDPYDDYRPDDRDPRHNRDYPMGRGDGYRPHHHQYHHHHHYYSREERYPPGPPPSGWSGSDRPYRSNPYPTSYNDRPPHHLHRRSLDHSNERRPSRRTSPTNNSSGPSRRDSTPVANDRYEKSDEKSKRPGRSDGDYSPYLGSRDSPTLPSRGGSERVGKVEDKSKRPTDSSTPSGIRDSLSVSSKGGPFERSEEKPRLTDRYHSESGPFVESRDASLSASRGPGLDRLDRMDDRPRRTDRPSQAENSPPNVRREFQPSTQRFDRLDKGEDRSRRNDRAPSDPTPFSAKDIAPLSSRGGPLDDRQRPQDRFSADFDSRDLPSLSTRMGGYSRDEERSRRTDRQQSDFPPSSGQRDYNSSGLREPSVSALPSSRYERGGKDEAGMLRRADRVQAETMVPSGSRDNLSSLSSGGRADKLDKEDGKLVDKVPAEGSVSLTVKDSSSVKRTASPKKDGKDDESLKRADRSSISDAIGSSGSRDPVSSLPRTGGTDGADKTEDKFKKKKEKSEMVHLDSKDSLSSTALKGKSEEKSLKTESLVVKEPKDRSKDSSILPSKSTRVNPESIAEESKKMEGLSMKETSDGFKDLSSSTLKRSDKGEERRKMDTSKELKDPERDVSSKTTRVNPADKSDEKSKVWISKEAKEATKSVSSSKEATKSVSSSNPKSHGADDSDKGEEKTKSESLMKKSKGSGATSVKASSDNAGKGETKLKKAEIPSGDILSKDPPYSTKVNSDKAARLEERARRSERGSSTSRTPRDPPSSAVKSVSRGPPSSAAKSDGRGRSKSSVDKFQPLPKKKTESDEDIFEILAAVPLPDYDHDDSDWIATPKKRALEKKKAARKAKEAEKRALVKEDKEDSNGYEAAVKKKRGILAEHDKLKDGEVVKEVKINSKGSEKYLSDDDDDEADDDGEESDEGGDTSFSSEDDEAPPQAVKLLKKKRTLKEVLFSDSEPSDGDDDVAGKRKQNGSVQSLAKVVVRSIKSSSPIGGPDSPLPVPMSRSSPMLPPETIPNGIMISGRKRAIPYSAINQTDRSGRTPIFKFANRGDFESVKAFIVAGADVNVRDNAGWTPLHEASLEGHKEVVELLVSYGADVNSAGLDGETPLHDACDRGHSDVAELLLIHGAQLNAIDKKGRLPVDVASDDTKELVEEWQVMIERVVKVDEDGRTLLHLSAESGDLDGVKKALKFGADVDFRDNANWTPLHEAAYKGFTEVVEELLRYGAEVDALGGFKSKDSLASTAEIGESSLTDGITPLMCAAAALHVDSVKLLLEFGADPEATSNDGRKVIDHLGTFSALTLSPDVEPNGTLDEEQKKAEALAKEIEKDHAEDWKAQIRNDLTKSREFWLPLRIAEFSRRAIWSSSSDDVTPRLDDVDKKASQTSRKHIGLKHARRNSVTSDTSMSTGTNPGVVRSITSVTASTAAAAGLGGPSPFSWGGLDPREREGPFESSREERKFKALLKTLQRNKSGAAGPSVTTRKAPKARERSNSVDGASPPVLSAPSTGKKRGRPSKADKEEAAAAAEADSNGDSDGAKPRPEKRQKKGMRTSRNTSADALSDEEGKEIVVKKEKARGRPPSSLKRPHGKDRESDDSDEDANGEVGGGRKKKKKLGEEARSSSSVKGGKILAKEDARVKRRNERNEEKERRRDSEGALESLSKGKTRRGIERDSSPEADTREASPQRRLSPSNIRGSPTKNLPPIVVKVEEGSGVISEPKSPQKERRPSLTEKSPGSFPAPNKFTLPAAAVASTPITPTPAPAISAAAAAAAAAKKKPKKKNWLGISGYQKLGDESPATPSVDGAPGAASATVTETAGKEEDDVKIDDEPASNVVSPIKRDPAGVNDEGSTALPSNPGTEMDVDAALESVDASTTVKVVEETTVQIDVDPAGIKDIAVDVVLAPQPDPATAAAAAAEAEEKARDKEIIKIAAEKHLNRRKRCLPLYFFLLPSSPSDLPEQRGKRYVVDFQVALYLGLSNGREVLDRFPMLRRRVATRSEKARLQASPVGESILAAIMEAKGLGSGPEAVVPRFFKWMPGCSGGRALQLVDVDIQLLDAEQVMAEVVVSGAGVVESEELELEAFPLATETSAGTPPPPITPAVNATASNSQPVVTISSATTTASSVSVTATTPITFTSSISVSTSTLTIPSLIPATTTPSTVSANHSNATFSQPTAAPAAAAPPPSHQPPSHQHIFPAMVPRKRKPTASMEMGAFPPAPATPSTSTSAASSASSSPASSSSHVVVGVGGVGYVHKLKRLAGAPGGEGKEGS